MLIRYKKNMEKIAMGLLSFMPEEKDVKKLQDTIKSYEESDDWHLHLWREEKDVLGAIGLRMEGNQAIIQHISVNPSHRNSGLGKKMVEMIQDKYYESYTLTADDHVEAFFKKCIEDDTNDVEQE